MARSTKASNAVLRLKQRSANAPYSMVSTGAGHFFLVLGNDPDTQEQLCPALEIDEFVAFVNGVHKEAPRKASKLDLAFEAKLTTKKSI
ncbi:MAG: hypothetical protein HY253_09080 [Burkholderiales bacterium]|nr:hypothetical protein [Burkholderiales bacterium]